MHLESKYFIANKLANWHVLLLGMLGSYAPNICECWVRNILDISDPKNARQALIK